jgi:hypothetical protein
MAKLSKYAARGGILLTVFGAAGMCGKIGSAGNVQQQNEILWVDGAGIIGGVGGGFAASLAVGLIFVSGPVGWVGAVIASAAGGYLAQKAGKVIGKSIYDQYANTVDLVGHSGIGQLCR